MSSVHVTDVNLTPKDVSNLASPDAIAAFFARLGYTTDGRAGLTAEAIGLSGDSASAVKQIELLSEDGEGFLRVVFVQLRSLTAKSRNDLARVLGRSNVDHLLVLTSDFSCLEFVLLHKRRREVRGPGKATAIQVVPLMVAVERKAPTTKELRVLRRFTWTGRDGLEQYDKLRSVFEASAFTEEYFCNRALFADHYLVTRLREDPAWKDNPSDAFHAVRDLLKDARQRWLDKGEQIVRNELYKPLFELLGFQAKVSKPVRDGQIKPDYTLTSRSGDGKTAAFVYSWDRWLDGPDFNLDHETPEENPGACVVTALDEGAADWIIVTNGRQWRLYSKNAHSRATNFYEVDLAEALVASGDTDPNEAFRYWWLFFRSHAFQPTKDEKPGCWLDGIAEGSRDYAKRLGDRLKDRVFLKIFRHLALGLLEDRKKRLNIRRQPSEEELRDIYEATLTLLYRILFLLYAEARDLLPIREAPYREASLRKIKEEIAEKGGVAESEVEARLNKAYSTTECELYDRLMRLCAAMDKGDPSLNVPIYNGGLFITTPDESDSREQRIARFLDDHKVPDRFLALAIDRLARDPDDKTFELVAIDYKSLEVRHLGSIYEGLLEFKLKIAEEDLTTAVEKKKEKYIPLGKAKARRSKQPTVEVHKGEIYLSNDKAERKASGSYYTPDPIVEYIVEHTVGPVLNEKLEALRGEFRKVRKTFDNEVQKATAYPVKKPSGETWDPREFAGQKTYINHKDLVDRLFDFRTLDPAMGSGHFLVEAVDFITDRLLAYLNQFPVNPVTFMLNETRKNILEALGQQGIAVDPDKLTEVNLLKRHVLKRCIYGVDLNPMAVELAKVSLWLDAFTIGAPLSFLDHHLRCGNSLIGATFKNLEAATKGQLFGIDYGPLLRAIHDVIFINKMADATSAEVKQSALKYSEARDELSGYQVVLDLLVAKHFAVPEGIDLLKRGGQDLDLSSRAKFRQSLEDLNELAIVERVETVAKQSHLRFFHWEIEFPEVFFGFADADQRHLKHKNDIARGSAGFDAVVGNPPYVRMDLIDTKSALSAAFTVFNSNADLYVYFIEHDYRVLRDGGRVGIIVSNKFLRSKYAPRLRKFLSCNTSVLFVHDFRSLPVFVDASAYPCILVFSRGQPESGHECIVSAIPELNWGKIADDLAANGRPIKQTALSDGEWIFADVNVASMLDNIAARSIPLSDLCNGRIRKGIETGCNSAFLIDVATRDAICKADKQSARYIRPILRGRDAKRYLVSATHFILLTSDISDLNKVPGIRDHLLEYRDQLQDRTESSVWYKHRRLHSHFSELEADKIAFPNINERLAFAMCPSSILPLNKVYYIVNSSFALLGVLNSLLMTFVAHQYMPHLRGDYLSMEAENIGRLPIHRAVQSPRLPTPQLSASLCEFCAKDSIGIGNRITALADETDPAKIAGAIAWLAQWMTTRRLECPTDEAMHVSDAIDQLVFQLYDVSVDEAPRILAKVPNWPSGALSPRSEKSAEM